MMIRSWIATGRAIGIAALLAATSLPNGSTLLAAGNDPDATVATVLAEKLPNVPGKTLTAVLVRYAPGGKSPRHHHAGSVFAYVLSGAIRSQNSATGPAKVYHAGETFFEPPRSEHLVSENDSTTRPASLLAVIVADDGAQLTTYDK